jgi:hypothetical protein
MNRAAPPSEIEKQFPQYSRKTVYRARQSFINTNENTNETKGLDTMVSGISSTVQKVNSLSPKLGKALEEITAPPKFQIDTAICVTVTLKRPSNTGSVDLSTIEVDAEKSALRVSKELLKSAAFQKIQSLDVQIRQYMHEVCIPGHKFLKGGMYLVPPTMLTTVDEMLIGFFEQRAALIEEFISSYPQNVEEAKNRLRALFNEAEYLSPNQIRNGFFHDHSYFSFKAAGNLQKISAEICKREEEKAKKRVDEFVKDIEATLTLQAQSVVSDLIDRIKGGDDGKPKMLRKDTVEGWQKFFALLKERNVSGNVTLNEIAETGANILNGITSEDIKKSDITKKNLLDTFQELQGSLSETVTVKPKRKLKFD